MKQLFFIITCAWANLLWGQTALQKSDVFPWEKLKTHFVSEQQEYAPDAVLVAFLPSLTDSCGYAQMLRTAFDNYFAQGLAWAGQNVPPFVPPADLDGQARYQETRAACVDYCGEQSFEVRLLDHGIATSHGQMPQRLRRLMTDLIDRRICPVTLATATLTEGVNLPFDIIFLTSLERRSFDTQAQQPIVVPMSTAEFRNLAGRAGRPGAAESIEGITLVTILRR